MSRRLRLFWVLLTSATMCFSGCAPTQPFYFHEDGDLSHYIGAATNIEYPDVEQATLCEVEGSPAPLTLENAKFEETWDLSLEEAVRFALENSKIMRTLGGRLAPNGPRPGQSGQTDGQIAATPGTLLTQPAAVSTVYDPAIIETGPSTGVESALAEFDAQLTSSLFWEKNDRLQNVAAGGFGGFFNPVRQQDLGTFQAGITKRTASGGRVGVFNNTIFDDNNSPTRDVASDWTTNFETQWSQPLLQGAGSQFNRIAGPFDPFNGDGTATFDGVVLARINTDIALADFEAGVRNLVNDVENTYWELYFVYRNLETRKVGRDAALKTWKDTYVRVISGQQTKGDEAQAREQYFFFRAQVEAALSDLYKIENRLRYLMGLAATDGRLIRPSDAPSTARVAFDWHEIHGEALVRSVELRQQKWRIKQRELELIAAKNLLLPRLDAVARYRWLGVGDELSASDGAPGGGLTGTGAAQSLSDGDFQEWQLGLQFSMPIGFRRELSTVRNQQLLLARERCRLQDQELELSHQLADALRDLDANYAVTQSNLNRLAAAETQVDAAEELYNVGAERVDLLLDAQRRRADAESAYYRGLVDYNRGIVQVHLRKNSLLEYNGVYLAEGPWPAKAYFDAHKLARQRDAGYFLDYGYTRPKVFSQGPYEQHHGSVHGAIEGAPFEGEEILTPTPAKEEPETEGELPEPEPTTAEAPAADGPRLSMGGEGPAFEAPQAKTASLADGRVQQADYRLVWKPNVKHEPVATHPAPQNSRALTGWKRAQR